jgi:hypothetical protein
MLGESLALGAPHGSDCALHVREAKVDTVIIPGVEFREVAVQVLFSAVPKDALNAALED